MIIHIPLEDLEPPYNNPLKIESLWQVGIDYATNTIDACDRYEDTCVSIFHFDAYDIRLSNRWNTYEISTGSAGITINIISTQ